MINLILINLIFLAVIAVFLIFLLRSRSERWRFLLLILTSFLIVFYIRAIVFSGIIHPFGDEQAYIEILKLKEAGIGHPVSGVGYLYFIYYFSKFLGLSFSFFSVLFSVLITTISIGLLYYIYRKNTKEKELAIFSCMIVLTTSYFIYPIIEARPQQLGMFLVLIGVILAERYVSERNVNYALFFSIFLVFTFFYHILSFFILVFATFIIFIWSLVDKKVRVRELLFLPLLFSLCLFFYLVSWSPYLLNKIDIINTSRILWERISLDFVLISLPLLLIIFILMLLGMNYLSGYENKRRRVKFFPLIFILSGAVLFLQFFLNMESYFDFYNNSILLFLFFQSCNIFFGIFYLIGAKRILEEGGRQDIFFRASVCLLILGIIVLIPSIFLDFALNNIFIRVLNYWTVFAAPVSAYAVIKKIKPKKMRIVIIPIVILIAIVNASRNPLIFRF
jgi:hypothetical protein